MTEQQILQAFNGRWRIKGEPLNFIPDVKQLCFDFFRAGILLGEGSVCGDSVVTTSPDDSFSTWWEMYGKKIDRAKCEKKWAKLSPEEKQACIAATPAYVASTPDLQYRRHPMTYLNNKSWQNQIIPHNANTQQSLNEQRTDKLASILTD